MARGHTALEGTGTNWDANPGSASPGSEGDFRIFKPCLLPVFITQAYRICRSNRKLPAAGRREGGERRRPKILISMREHQNQEHVSRRRDPSTAPLQQAVC